MPHRTVPIDSDVAAKRAPKFWARVNKRSEDQCWLWTGGTIPTGYGTCQIAGRAVLTHRLAYHLTHGPIPEGLLILHSCDTPACVNPAHLRTGTAKENVHDMMRRSGRFTYLHGSRSMYVQGCRCDDCRDANTTYQRKRAREVGRSLLTREGRAAYDARRVD